MTTVRHMQSASDQGAVEHSDGTWVFRLGGHESGPLYQTHGTAERFTPADMLTNYTTGDSLLTDCAADVAYREGQPRGGVDVAGDGRLRVSEGVVNEWVQSQTSREESGL